MKKIIAAIAACALIMALFAGCGGQQAQQQVTRKSAKEATGDEAKVLSAIESLETYMVKKGFLTEDIVKYSTDEELPKIDGVKEAVVNFMALKMHVEFEDGADEAAVMKKVRKACRRVDDDAEVYI